MEKRKCRGIGVEVEVKCMHSLQFPGDQVIVTQDKDGLEYMTIKIHEEYEKWGMKIKTKYICIVGLGSVIVFDNGEKYYLVVITDILA